MATKLCAPQFKKVRVLRPVQLNHRHSRILRRKNTRSDFRRWRAFEFNDVRIFGLAIASAPSSLDRGVFSERCANVFYISFAQHVALQEAHYYALEDDRRAF